MTERVPSFFWLALALCLTGCSGKKGLDPIGTAQIIDGDTRAQREIARAKAALVVLLTRAAAANPVTLAEGARCGTYPTATCTRFQSYPIATRRILAGIAVVAAQDALVKLPSLRFVLWDEKPEATGADRETIRVVGRKSPTVELQVDLWRSLAENAAVDENGAHELLVTMAHEVGHFLTFDALAEPVTDFGTVEEVAMAGGDVLDALVFFWSQRNVSWTLGPAPANSCGTPDFSLTWGNATPENGGSLDGSLTLDRSGSYTATGDFDGDGRGDIVAAGCPIQFFLSDGIQRFNVVVPSSAPLTPAWNYQDYLFSGDFNGDGIDDVAIANREWREVHILFSEGAGAFHRTDFAVGDLSPLVRGGAHQFVTGDFNGDHLDDFAYFDPFSGGARVFLSNGIDAFRAEEWTKDSLGGERGRFTVRSGDFNGDGLGDFLILTPLEQGGAFVWLSNGSNRFQLQQWPTGVQVIYNDPLNSITIGDFNGDGRSDFAQTRTGWTWARILLSNGVSRFDAVVSSPPRQLWTTGASSPFLMAGDFDGDGKTDFTNYNGAEGVFTMLLSLGNRFF